MKLKNDYELVGQMLRQKFEESGHNVFTRRARYSSIIVTRLHWLARGGRSRLNRREIEAMRRAFGDEFAAGLQAAAGHTAAQSAKQDKEAEVTARVLGKEIVRLREELALNEAEGDEPELRTAVLTMLEQCQQHLDGWATYRQSNYDRAADLLTAAEHLYKAADLTYRASHPPVRPHEQWADAPPHRHRYAVDEASRWWLRPATQQASAS